MTHRISSSHHHHHNNSSSNNNHPQPQQPQQQQQQQQYANFIAHTGGGGRRSHSPPSAVDSPPPPPLLLPNHHPHHHQQQQQIPRVLDVIGCHKELTICGHVDLINKLPIRQREHMHLLREYVKRPGNYEGRYSDFYNAPARILDYGNHYLALRLYEDITRPELGEFLLEKGWKMIGFTSNKEDNKTFIIEKWCNIRDH